MVNDVAERNTKLIEDYNFILTKDKGKNHTYYKWSMKNILKITVHKIYNITNTKLFILKIC